MVIFKSTSVSDFDALRIALDSAVALAKAAAAGRPAPGAAASVLAAIILH